MEENKTLKEYLRKFLEGYKYVVENRYNYQFSSNPEAFPFMRKDDYKISIFYLNQSFFEEPCIVVISNDSKLKEIYNFRNIDIKYLSKHFTSYIYDSKKYVEEQSGLLDFNNYIYYTSIYYGKYIGTVILQNNLDLFFNYGKRLANDHYNTLISKSKERLINKAHDEIQPFNHLDLNSMKEIVDDITFSYQIEQGLQAYKRELYLPAAATFAVAIETFLIKLKKVNDKDFETHIVEAYDCFMSEKRLATSLLLGRALELMCRLILNKFDKDIIKQTPDYKRNIRTFLNEMENNDLIEEHLKHSVKAAIEHRNSIMHGIKIEEYNSIIQTLFDEIAKLSNVYKSLNKQ